MKSFHLTFLVAAVLGATAFSHAAVAEAPTIVKFSDPSKPGTLKILVARGDIRIQGSDTQEVSVTTDLKPSNQKRKDGLRVLTAASSYSLTEKDNVITLDSVSDGWKSNSSNFSLTVPRRTNVVIQNSFGGATTCVGISGDLEINSMNGEIRLDDVSGGLVVQTMNGEIKASIAQLTEGKPLSFTSMNGEVALRLPPAAKANLRFRTQNGSVLTDFPDHALVTKTETSPRTASAGGSGGVLPPEARHALREAGRVAAEAAREVEAAMREAAQAAREGAAAAREGAAEGRADDARPPKPASPPKPVMAARAPKVPVIPTITGGKLLTGTLNGGGPEISVATMNGDVVLRQLDK